MPGSRSLAAILFAVSAALLASPAAAQGEIVITQAKALAGNVTPGDTAGYPVTLSLSGSYILGGNLTVPANQNGISINAHNVDLDLNGFAIIGNGVAYNGILSGYGESRIHNGAINRFRSAGILLRNNVWMIEDMRITRNGGMGIDAFGSDLITVRTSTIASNGTYGMLLDDNAVVESNTVAKNTDVGVFISQGGRVEGNEVSDNGDQGIVINNGGIVTANSIRSNGSYGIDNGPSGVSITNNSLYLNNSAGTEQILGGINGYGNACVGKAC